MSNTLKNKIKPLLLSIILIFTLLIAAIVWFLNLTFSEIEHDHLYDNTFRTKDALLAVIDNLHMKSADWGSWNDTYEFMADHNEAYIQSNLGAYSIATLKLNIIAFLDTKGNLFEKRAIDIDKSQEVTFPTSLISDLVGHKLFFVPGDEQKSYSGLVELPEGVMLVSLRPILHSNLSGPVRGTLIFGQYLSERIISQVAKLVHFDFDIKPYVVTSQSSDYKKALKSPEGDFKYVIKQNTSDGYIIMNDLLDRPTILVHAIMPRKIHKAGLKVVYIFAAATALASLLVILIVYTHFKKRD